MRIPRRLWLAVALLASTGLAVGLLPGLTRWPPHTREDVKTVAKGTHQHKQRAHAAGAAADAPVVPKLTEVFYRSYESGGRDQYVRIENPTGADVDLSTWTLGDGRHEARFPEGTTLAAGAGIYVAHSARAFVAEHGFLPDFAFTGNEPGVEIMELPGAAPYWAHHGGQVELRDDDHDIIDVVPYGDSQYSGDFWYGDPVPAVGLGEVMHRGRDETTVSATSPGTYPVPTYTAADWKQGSEWVSLRVLRPGQSFLTYPTFEVSGEITAYSSPDSSLGQLEQLLDKACKSIDINMYMVHVPQLASRLVAALERGVSVRLLLEAQPPGGMDDQQRWFAQQVYDAGGQVRYMRGESDLHIHRRYVFTHAKYGIIDGKRVFVQSENWVAHGTPSDPSFGNRGWGIIVDDAALAAYLDDAFTQDWNPAVMDTVAFTPEDPTYGGPPDGFTPDTAENKGSYTHPFAAQHFAGPHRVTPVFAPDHTLYESKGIIGLMRGAEHRLLVEQQYIHLQWDGTGGTPDTTPDLFLREVLAAARRGVTVRVLLDADRETAAQPDAQKEAAPAYPTNGGTCDYLNNIAAAEKLDVQCRLLDREWTGLDKIHNKGVVADDQVLVSSINWSYNSPANNRELGLIIDGPHVADYFAGIFTWDWEGSA